MRGDLPVPGSTRARLLDVAIKKFGAQPYDEVDVKTIAAEAGVTIGALYHHFGSKNGLYAILRTEMFSRLLDRIEAATENAPDSSKLAAGVQAAFNGMLRIGAGHLLTAITGKETDPLANILTELAQAKNLSHPDATALLLASSVRTAVQQVTLHPERRETMQQALLALIPD